MDLAIETEEYEPCNTNPVIQTIQYKTQNLKYKPRIMNLAKQTQDNEPCNTNPGNTNPTIQTLR